MTGGGTLNKTGNVVKKLHLGAFAKPMLP